MGQKTTCEVVMRDKRSVGIFGQVSFDFLKVSVIEFLMQPLAKKFSICICMHEAFEVKRKVAMEVKLTLGILGQDRVGISDILGQCY